MQNKIKVQDAPSVCYVSRKVSSKGELMTQGFNLSKACWITHARLNLNPYIDSDSPYIFRRDFSLDEKPTKARLLITAADKYVLWINNELVMRGPARSFPKRKSYDVIDVGAFLEKGKNRIAVAILPPPVSPYHFQTERGLLFQLDITAGSNRVAIYSDDTWLCRRMDWLKFNTNIMSLPTGHQEHFSFPKEPKDWKSGTIKKSQWQPTYYLGPIGYSPWNTLEPRQTHLLLEEKYKPELVWQGRTPDDNHSLEGIDSKTFNELRIDGNHIDSTKALKVAYKSGEGNNVFVFDCHRTRHLIPGFEVKNASGDIRVDLFYDLQLTERPTSYTGFDNPNEGFHHSVTLKEGKSTWQALQPVGFRFVTIVFSTLSDQSGCELKPLINSIDYPFDDPSTYQTNDTFLNDLWRISSDSIRSCTNDVYVDCCSRENLLWTLDSCVIGKAAYYTFGELEMWRHNLTLISQGIRSDGRPSANLPTRWYCSLYGQSLQWIVYCWDYYMKTGDVDLLKEVCGPIVRMLQHISEHIASEGYFIPPQYSWYFVDWAPLDRRPFSLPINAVLLYACIHAEKIAKVLGDTQLMKVNSPIKSTLSKSLKHFYDKEEGAYLGRIEPSRDLKQPPVWILNQTDLENVSKHSIHGTVLMAEYLKSSKTARNRSLKWAAEKFDAPFSSENRIGLNYINVLLKPMVEAGFAKEAMNYVRTVYKPFIDIGAPSWNSQPRPVKKFNTAHAWGASVNSLMVEGILGLNPLEPGYDEFSLDPTNIGVDIDYSLKTVRGVISIQIKNNRLTARWPKDCVCYYKNELVSGKKINAELG